MDGPAGFFTTIAAPATGRGASGVLSATTSAASPSTVVSAAAPPFAEQLTQPATASAIVGPNDSDTSITAPIATTAFGTTAAAARINVQAATTSVAPILQSPSLVAAPDSHPTHLVAHQILYQQTTVSVSLHQTGQNTVQGITDPSTLQNLLNAATTEAVSAGGISVTPEDSADATAEAMVTPTEIQVPELSVDDQEHPSVAIDIVAANLLQPTTEPDISPFELTAGVIADSDAATHLTSIDVAEHLVTAAGVSDPTLLPTTAITSTTALLAQNPVALKAAVQAVEIPPSPIHPASSTSTMAFPSTIDVHVTAGMLQSSLAGAAAANFGSVAIPVDHAVPTSTPHAAAAEPAAGVSTNGPTFSAPINSALPIGDSPPVPAPGIPVANALFDQSDFAPALTQKQPLQSTSTGGPVMASTGPNTSANQAAVSLVSAASVDNDLITSRSQTAATTSPSDFAASARSMASAGEHPPPETAIPTTSGRIPKTTSVSVAETSPTTFAPAGPAPSWNRFAAAAQLPLSFPRDAAAHPRTVGLQDITAASLTQPAGTLTSTSTEFVAQPASAQPPTPLTNQLLTALVQQHANVIHNDLNNLTLRLDPPELGQLDVEFIKSAEGISVRVSAEEAVTMEMLASRGTEIERMLLNQNSDFVRVEFASRDADGGDFADHSASFSERQREGTDRQTDGEQRQFVFDDSSGSAPSDRRSAASLPRQPSSRVRLRA